MSEVDIKLQWGLTIPLRDGIQLNATLYLPANVRPASPAICAMTPYVAQYCHDQAMYFASRGYPFLAVDVRGRGNSEGEFHPINEAKDAYDVIEWLAQQSFCNGQVAMWGGSYSGYVQWSATKEHPPHLVAIAPVASPYRGVDSPVRNNIFMPYTMQWLTLTAGRTLQEKLAIEDRSFWRAQFRRWLEAGVPFKTLDAFVGNPSKLFQEWISHPHQGAYWDSYNPRPQDYARLKISVLTITGMYDANQPGALAHYGEYMKHAPVEGRTRHCLVIGPWDHAGTRTPRVEFGGMEFGQASLVDLQKLHLEWYAWVLQGERRPSFLRKNVAYYVTGADKWRYADTLDAVTAEYAQFFLHSSGNPTDVFKSGSLLTKPSHESSLAHYVYDPRDVRGAGLESTIDPDDLLDQRMIHASVGKRLIYHSAPFTNSVEISGFFKLSLWIAIDQLDTDFRAEIYEITLDGSSIRLSSDSLRARYRESFREPKLVHTQAPLRYEFERFTFVSRQIGIGSRLRLVVGPIDSIHSQKNYNSGGNVAEESMHDARVVTVRLLHDDEHPSVLHVPIASPETRDLEIR